MGGRDGFPRVPVIVVVTDASPLIALETHADRLIVDERAGRRVAEALGLRVAGVLGLLVLSKRRGLMPAVRLALEDFEVSTPTPPQRTLTWWSAS